MPLRFDAPVANTCLQGNQFLSILERPVEFAANDEYVA